MMTDKLEVSRRRVWKDWHLGLHPDPVDRSHPDVNDDQLVKEAAEMKLFSSKLINKSRQEVKSLNINPLLLMLLIFFGPCYLTSTYRLSKFDMNLAFLYLQWCLKILGWLLLFFVFLFMIWA